LELIDPEKNFFQEIRPIRFVNYLFWLIVEIGKADWQVTKVILAPKKPQNQSLIVILNSQSSDLGKAFFANSITITPGTVTVETEDDCFIVHALTEHAADRDALADMDRRVTAIEYERAS